MEDAVSFAVNSSEQVQELLTKMKAALSKLYGMVFPKLNQEKTLGELAEDIFIDHADPIEVLKRSSRAYGALLTFQLLMGHGVAADFKKCRRFFRWKKTGLRLI